MATARKIARLAWTPVHWTSVWFWHWSASWPLELIFSVGWGVLLGSGEYLLSLSCLGLATVGAISMIVHWQPPHKNVRTARGLRVIAVFGGSALLTLVTLANKGDKPWSNVPDYLVSGDLRKPDHDRPDVGIEILNPTAPAVTVVPLNGIVAHEVTEDPLVWDLDLEDLTHSLRVNEAKYDWIRADQHGGPYPVLQTDDAKDKVKPGHRILGFISVTCPLCKRVRAYWVYFVWGQGGWYAEIPEGSFPLPNKLALALPEIRLNPEIFFSGVPQSSRKLIAGDLP